MTEDPAHYLVYREGLDMAGFIVFQFTTEMGDAGTRFRTVSWDRWDF
jgi:hypothetical protein